MENIYSINYNENTQITINQNCLETLESIENINSFSIYFPEKKSDLIHIKRLNNLCDDHPNEVKRFIDSLNTINITDTMKIAYTDIMKKIYYAE